jgi:hypothetical protein
VRLCITQHVNELNIDLQGANHFASESFDKMTALEKKLRVWEVQMQSNNMTHFPFLRTEKLTHAKKYPKMLAFSTAIKFLFSINAGILPQSIYFQ